EDDSAAVYGGADIVYYKAGQDETYGEGGEEDGHTQEEAAENTVITIATPGTYRVTGSLSKGQIAVDLGEDAKEDETAVVNLILDEADMEYADLLERS
ncbi:MAG: carbohydrate-binding domain-containing protein, partial [Lachnospiraceae bacterium]|nr:carbohydrate-binding domain-containing protein [Lachnospiraceae bacterium]